VAFDLLVCFLYTPHAVHISIFFSFSFSLPTTILTINVSKAGRLLENVLPGTLSVQVDIKYETCLGINYNGSPPIRRSADAK
jgi:hypothetical protein